jgi:adenylate cyclase
MSKNIPAPVLTWLQTDGVKQRDSAKFIAQFAAELVAAGIDIYRLTTGVHIIHPQIDASSALWQQGKAVTERRWKMDRQVLQNSPMPIVYSGRSYRARLDGAAEPGEFPILTELRAEGVTEYIAFPLPFSDGSWKAVSYATCRAGGFPEDLAMILEIQTLQRTTLTLLDMSGRSPAGACSTVQSSGACPIQSKR